MKLYFKDNGITTASSRKLEQKNLNLCIVRQKNKSTEKFSSTDNSTGKLRTASKTLKVGLLGKFNDTNILCVKYHIAAVTKHTKQE